LAAFLTGSGSGLMGRRGSSHGQSKSWPYCDSHLRPDATGELAPRSCLVRVRPWTWVQMVGLSQPSGAIAGWASRRPQGLRASTDSRQ
jgi:hypothetical protein